MYALVFHAHQKLDKIAYNHLKQLLPENSYFPTIEQIVHFDGTNGPDSPKLKRLCKGEQPWHFINPTDNRDTELENQINYHYKQLVLNLKRKDEVRSAFEAAWLAHALVDGLTPAHHYPYEKELEQLRGECRQTRKGIIGRAFIKGETLTQSLIKSLKLIGPKGLVTTHAMFEAGAYAIIAPLRLSKAMPTSQELAIVRHKGITKEFKDILSEITNFDIYSRFCNKGWTQSLSQDVKQQLAPRMVRMVTLAWYSAYSEAMGT